MRSVVAVVLNAVLAGGLAAPAMANEAVIAGSDGRQAVAADAQIRDLGAVVVTGVQPGPGLWKVVGGDGHVLWVLATVDPLPQQMQWRSNEVEAAIAQSDEVLWEPGISMHWDIGFFSGLALLPSAMRIRRNPDGQTLDDVLPGDLHARWLEQKERYLGWEMGVERWRPMFAADKLQKAALKEHGLGEAVARQQLRRMIENAGIEPTPVNIRTDVDEPRALVREYNRTGVNDVACMEGTLQQLEAGMSRLVARANAWATGDIDTLRGIPAHRVDRGCISAVLESDFAQRQGYGDIAKRVRTLWIEQAERALAANAVTFALLPMDEVLSVDGMLAALVARGYRLLSPEGVRSDDAEVAAAAAAAPTGVEDAVGREAP